MTSTISDASVVPRVGIGCFVQDAKGRVLLGKRIGSHGSGTLALPGGHLELHESFVGCAAREVLEETGIELRSSIKTHMISVLGVVNSTNMRDINQPFSVPSRHYVTIFCSGYASPSTQEARNLEPEKCQGWAWVPFQWLASMARAQYDNEFLKANEQALGRTLRVSREDKSRTAQEASEWREADEFAGDAPLFEPLVNCFLEMYHLVSNGLP